jgi:hypothetical protein
MSTPRRRSPRRTPQPDDDEAAVADLLARYDRLTRPQQLKFYRRLLARGNDAIAESFSLQVRSHLIAN